MCSPVGPVTIEMDEIRWYRYRCEDCGKIYKSTGERFSACPDCGSEHVVKL